MVESMRKPKELKNRISARTNGSMRSALFRSICLQVIITLTVDLLRSDCRCVFPNEWMGEWYENRFGVVSNFSEKGDCIDSHDGYYLFENKEIGCYVCLQIEQRHLNVLQYKESFCSGKAPMQTICSTIQQETMQHTIIRGTGDLTHCPFQGAYHFIYNNNSGGVCRFPASYAKPCAGGSKFVFHFNHCPNAAYSYTRVAVVECLATWTEGSARFLVVRWTGEVGSTAPDEFRCFMHHQMGSVVYASMSADGSCRGLRSPTNGPVVIEFTQDTLGWPRPRCSFPSWMTKTSWKDLSGTRLFKADENNDVIESYVRKTMTSPKELYKTHRCFSVLTPETSEDVLVIVHVSDGCSSGYQCLRLRKKSENLTELSESIDVKPFCHIPQLLTKRGRISSIL